jgi:molybdopterin synthase sulfur carrier subunit
MKILYFAWVRQRTGIAEEEIELPPRLKTVGDLVGWLKTRDEAFEFAFGEPRAIRAAVDQEHVAFDHPLKGAREIAFFPPVTGG